jgi:iron complex outermembrane recepter protein
MKIWLGAKICLTSRNAQRDELPEALMGDKAAVFSPFRTTIRKLERPSHSDPSSCHGARSPSRRKLKGDPVARSGAKMAASTALCVATASFCPVNLLAQSTTGPAGPAPSADDVKTLNAMVVSAKKNTDTIKTTPDSITTVSGDDLQDRGIANVTTLAQATPGVSLKSEGPGQTEIEIRGMAATGGDSPTTGFYLDDIPLTSPANAQNGKVVIDPTLYDLDSVEVLRGPQGTQSGAGSMGGSVRLITNQPELGTFEGSVQSTLSGTDGGGFNHSDNVMLNIPLAQDMALRVVATEAHTSGWIDRIVGNPYPLVSPNGAVRGDVQAAPIQAQYPGSNAQQLDGFRATLLWKPTDSLSITPSFFYQYSHQDGISAYDSVPATDAHYQPFNIAEPLTDRISIFSLNVRYSFDSFDLTSTTAQWNRRSTQTEDASEDFNNPNTGVTYASNYGLPNPGYYGPGGSGVAYGHENDPSGQFSEELRLASKGDGNLHEVGGLFFSNFSSTWNFNGTTENPSAYMDLGTFAPATTTHWFDALSPTRLIQSAIFGDLTYDITPQLSAEVGARFNHYDYRFSSVISGWGSALGAATPSASGVIEQSGNSVDPKFSLSYQLDPDVSLYATVAKGSRPGGGNAKYPTTGEYWSAVFSAYKFSGSEWPSSYRPDSVWSYEVGEKGSFLDHRLTVNASVYYEDWRNIQLEALPGDWALNINGNRADIYGGDIETRTVLGGGFELAISSGYTHAWVAPGPHWQITPTHALSDVAPVNANAIFSYSRNLSSTYTLKLQLENAYVGRRYSLAFPYGYSLNGEYIRLPSYDLTNLRATLLSSDNWDASLFANNLFNKRAELESLFQENLPSAAFNRIVTNQPRTIGVDVTYRF